MHQFKRRRMDRVASKIAQEIPVLFKNDHRNAGAGQQATQHHAGRAASDDTAIDLHRPNTHARTVAQGRLFVKSARSGLDGLLWLVGVGRLQIIVQRMEKCR